MTRNNLIYAVDLMGMVRKVEESPTERLQRLQQLLNPAYGWRINRAFFFQDLAEKHPVGHPDYLAANQRTIGYSRTNIGVRIQKNNITLRDLVPDALAPHLLLLGAIATLLLALAGKAGMVAAFPKFTWFAQAVFAGLVLLTAETVLGNWLAEKTIGYYLDLFSRTFDVLWWIVPALLLTLAIERFVWTPLEEKTGQTIPTILRRFVVFTVYLLAFFGVVGFVFDQKLTSLLATSGIIAMIIGLAIQINISNIFSGIALNLERPFRIGDWIMIHGRTPDPNFNTIGRVVDINWRTTRLETTGNCTVIIPNSSIAEKTITNFMTPDEISRFELRFCIDYSVPPERVIGVMTEAVKAVTSAENDGLLAEPAAKVRVNETTSMGVEYEVRYYIIPRQVSPAKARHTIATSVLEHLKQANISLAYPTQNIYYEEIDPQQLES